MFCQATREKEQGDRKVSTPGNDYAARFRQLVKKRWECNTLSMAQQAAVTTAG